MRSPCSLQLQKSPHTDEGPAQPKTFFKKGGILVFPQWLETLFWLCMQDLNPSTKDWTCAPCIESRVLTTGPPGKSQKGSSWLAPAGNLHEEQSLNHWSTREVSERQFLTCSSLESAWVCHLFLGTSHFLFPDRPHFPSLLYCLPKASWPLNPAGQGCL